MGWWKNFNSAKENIYRKSVRRAAAVFNYLRSSKQYTQTPFINLAAFNAKNNKYVNSKHNI